MSRYPDKELTKSFGSFETSVKLCQHSLSNKSSKRYSALLSTLEASFNRCDEEWRLYKEEMIKKGDLTEDLFIMKLKKLMDYRSLVINIMMLGLTKFLSSMLLPEIY